MPRPDRGYSAETADQGETAKHQRQPDIPQLPFRVVAVTGGDLRRGLLVFGAGGGPIGGQAADADGLGGAEPAAGQDGGAIAGGLDRKSVV